MVRTNRARRRGDAARLLGAAMLALGLGGCEIGPEPFFPPQAGPEEPFNPALVCHGVEPDPRFAKRCRIFRNR